MHNPRSAPAPRMTGVAIYCGASGRHSSYPVWDDKTVPPSITTASGEVRRLVGIEMQDLTPNTVDGATFGAIAAHAA